MHRAMHGIKHWRPKHWYIFTHFDTFSVIYDHIYDDDKYSLYRLLEFVQINFYPQSCRHSKQGATSPGSWWWCFRADWYLTILLTIYRLSPDMETSVTNQSTKHITRNWGWKGLHLVIFICQHPSLNNKLEDFSIQKNWQEILLNWRIEGGRYVTLKQLL